MSHFARYLRAPAALVAALAIAVVAMTSAPAEARRTDPGLGTWDGHIYVAKPKARSVSKGFSKAAKRQGYVKTATRAKSGKRTAALGSSSLNDATPYKRSVASGGGRGVRWAASSGCLNGHLRSVIAHVAANYGSVTVASTCRSHSHNRAVGGAKKSYHLTGDAADFRVHGNAGAAYAYLRGAVGGLKHYGGGRFHIDTGPRRAF